MPRANSNFDRLKDAVSEMIAMEAGEKPPLREHTYESAVLVEIREGERSSGDLESTKRIMINSFGTNLPSPYEPLRPL